MSVLMLQQALARQRHTGLLATTWLARRAFAAEVNSDSHDDFKPKIKAAPAAAGDVKAQIEQDIKSHDVFIYMKGVPTAPQCGFSNMACKVLDAYGVRFGARNVLADPAVRDGIKQYTSWPTIPQIFVKGEFIGGSDILYNMHETGELEKLLGPIIEQQQHAATK